MVLFAKITPKRVEATAFALLTGTSNLTGTVRSFVGSKVNEWFVGVTQEDLSNYWVLVLISAAMGITPLLYLWILPTKASIREMEDRDTKLATTESTEIELEEIDKKSL